MIMKLDLMRILSKTLRDCGDADCVAFLALAVVVVLKFIKEITIYLIQI